MWGQSAMHAIRTDNKPLMCGLGVPVGCRMKHAKGMLKRWHLGLANGRLGRP